MKKKTWQRWETRREIREKLKVISTQTGNKLTKKQKKENDLKVKKESQVEIKNETKNETKEIKNENKENVIKSKVNIWNKQTQNKK